MNTIDINDIKSGMIVEYHNGKKGLVYLNEFDNAKYVLLKDGYNKLDSIDCKLSSNYDIDAVLVARNGGPVCHIDELDVPRTNLLFQVIWERNHVITIEELINKFNIDDDKQIIIVNDNRVANPIRLKQREK